MLHSGLSILICPSAAYFGRSFTGFGIERRSNRWAADANLVATSDGHSVGPEEKMKRKRPANPCRCARIVQKWLNWNWTCTGLELEFIAVPSDGSGRTVYIAHRLMPLLACVLQRQLTVTDFIGCRSVCPSLNDVTETQTLKEEKLTKKKAAGIGS